MKHSGKPLKVIFLGTSEFAVLPLQSLLNSPHTVAAVVTKSDRISGRGRKQQPTPVKQCIEKLYPQIPLFQPESLKDSSFHQTLASLQPDIFVVASFPIMPQTLVELPPLGCLNIHPSLLPKYRGAAPIRWTLMNGDTVTGVTTFFIGGKIDAGNLFLQLSTEIYPLEDYGSLHNRLSQLGAELAVKSLDLISQGKVFTSLQDESQAIPAPKIRKEHCLIDWNKSAQSICNQIRALSPEPGAYTIVEGKRLKLYASQIHPKKPIETGKTFVYQDKLFIGCQDLCLELIEVQLEGKRRLKAADFLRGCKVVDSKLIL